MQNYKSKIKNTREWLENNLRTIILFFLIFLVSSISFGLGYLVNREFTHTPIIIEKTCN